jgi:hypothetical protein
MTDKKEWKIPTQEFNKRKLTGAELFTIEKKANGSEALNGYAIYWVWMKRANPDMTFEDALDMPQGDVMDLLGIEDDDPKES